MIKHALCALSNPGGEQQLKLLISGAALETVERKLNVERGAVGGEKGFRWGSEELRDCSER